MVVSAKTFEQLALEDSDNVWEMVWGQPRKKPRMTSSHNRVMTYLGATLVSQLDEAQFEVRVNSGHVRRTAQNYFVPDVAVIPTLMVQPFDELMTLEYYDQALPLVVEVWSPSTGDYDVQTKLVEYRRRGDAEICLIHPFERTLRAWRRAADGSYSETLMRGGTVQPVARPGVTINLDRLLRRAEQ